MAEEIVTLGIEVKTDGVKQGAESLDKLTWQRLIFQPVRLPVPVYRGIPHPALHHRSTGTGRRTG